MSARAIVALGPKVVRAFDGDDRRRRDRERRALPNRVVLARKLDRLGQIVAEDNRLHVANRCEAELESDHRTVVEPKDVVELIGEGTFGQIAKEPMGQSEVERVARQDEGRRQIDDREVRLGQAEPSVVVVG